MPKRRNYLHEGVGHLTLQDGTHALVSPEDFDATKDHTWHVQRQNTRTGKVYETIAGSPGMLHRFIAKRAFGKADGLIVDHINRDTRDNQRENLRLVTRAESSRNRGAWGKSKYKGVYWQEGGWAFSIRVHCETEEEAARMYNQVAALLYGEHAALNDVPDTLPESTP